MSESISSDSLNLSLLSHIPLLEDIPLLMDRDSLHHSSSSQIGTSGRASEKQRHYKKLFNLLQPPVFKKSLSELKLKEIFQNAVQGSYCVYKNRNPNRIREYSLAIASSQGREGYRAIPFDYEESPFTAKITTRDGVFKTFQELKTQYLLKLPLCRDPSILNPLQHEVVVRKRKLSEENTEDDRKSFGDLPKVSKKQTSSIDSPLNQDPFTLDLPKPHSSTSPFWEETSSLSDDKPIFDLQIDQLPLSFSSPPIPQKKASEKPVLSRHQRYLVSNLQKCSTFFGRTLTQQSFTPKQLTKIFIGAKEGDYKICANGHNDKVHRSRIAIATPGMEKNYTILYFYFLHGILVTQAMKKGPGDQPITKRWTSFELLSKTYGLTRCIEPPLEEDALNDSPSRFFSQDPEDPS